MQNFINLLKEYTTHKDRYVKGSSLRLYRRLLEIQQEEEKQDNTYSNTYCPMCEKEKVNDNTPDELCRGCFTECLDCIKNNQ